MKRFVGRKHKGDTLVEVTLAIGIFSMVAVAAVSVINISTTGAQSSLESTITREEIDGQAEALRFIQSAYIAGGEINESAPTKYAKLWQMITDHAIDISGLSGNDSDAILQYNPIACDKLYQKDSTAWDSLNMQKAFIINTHAMNSDNLNDIIVDYKNNNTKFGFAQTFPRLIYGNSNSDALYDPTINNATLHKAEGIYIIAVRDAGGTIVVEDSNGNISVKSAYIDFYIRSCWFTPNATRASTISTAIRLYDPDKVSINKYERQGIIVKYEKGADDATGTMPSQYVFTGKTVNLLQNTFSRPGYKFIGWKEKKSDGTIASAYSSQYTAPSNITEGQSVTFVAMWQRLFTLTYYNTNGSILCSEEFLSNGSDSHTFTIYGCPTAPTNPDVSKQVFQGWSERTDGREPLYDKVGGVSNTKNTITAQNGVYNLSLYPVWRVEVEFNNTEWSNFSDGATTAAKNYVSSGRSDCQIFNVNRTDGATSIQAVPKGTSYGAGRDITPMAGYLLYNGKNVETFNDTSEGGYGLGVNLQGYCNNPDYVTVGVYYDKINQNDTFELSAKMNYAGVLSHPDGYVTISIGPMAVQLNDTSISSSCNSSSWKKQSFSNVKDINGNIISMPDDKIIGIELRKYDDDYYVKLNGSKIVECSIPTSGNIRVSYSMTHGGRAQRHSCSIVFNAQLTNITMRQVQK